MSWDDELTYDYMRRLLLAATERARPILFSEAPAALDDQLARAEPSALVLLRHDIDLDLGLAVGLAEIEHELGLRATYMIMTACPLYRVEDAPSREALARLVELDHEIGLHFDAHEASGGRERKPEELEQEIRADCERLAEAVGAPVPSVSFHRPQPAFLRGALKVADRVNAYAADLMRWYLSDSKGSWREGDPLVALASPRSEVLQLLTHPIWWAEHHQTAPDRLESFFNERTAAMAPADRDRFDRDLAAAVPAVRRRGCTP